MLTGENRQYVISVLRMRRGEHLLLFDGKGAEYEAVIQDEHPDHVVLAIIKKEIIDAGQVKITLAQSLPKARKMDFIIEKASELGATLIIPFFSERSVPRLSPDQALAKQSRWGKIALEAARKSHSRGIPAVEAVMSFSDMLLKAEEKALKIIFWEEETDRHLKHLLQERKPDAHKELFLVVGPEGGFAREEIELAKEKGFYSVTLGKQILKVETAALAVLSIIQYEKGIFNPGDLSEGRS